MSVSCIFALFHFHYHSNYQGKRNENAQTMRITYEILFSFQYNSVCERAIIVWSFCAKWIKRWMMTRNQLIHTQARSNTFAAHHIYGPCKQWKEQQLRRKRNGENKTATTYTHTHKEGEPIQSKNKRRQSKYTVFNTVLNFAHNHTHTHIVRHISGELYCLPIYLLNTKIRHVLDWIEVASIEGNSQYLFM